MSRKTVYSRGGQLLSFESEDGKAVNVAFGGVTGAFTVDDLFDALLELKRGKTERQPSYSLGRDLYADRVVEGCSDCRPGHPCYGHGH